MEEAGGRQKRQLRKYTYRGLEIDKLMSLSNENLIELFCARQRRRFNRGLKHKYARFINKIRKAKKNVPTGDKPPAVKTHLRNCIVVPEMVGSIVGIHNGKEFANVEIRFDMIGRYLGEFAITYKPCKHGKPGIGASKGSVNANKTWSWHINIYAFVFMCIIFLTKSLKIYIYFNFH